MCLGKLPVKEYVSARGNSPGFRLRLGHPAFFEPLFGKCVLKLKHQVVFFRLDPQTRA